MRSITRPVRRNRYGEKVQPYSFSREHEYILHYGGYSVIMTDHCRQQTLKRHGMPPEKMLSWFRQAIDAINFSGFKPAHYDQEVFIYNRHFKRGMIVAFRRDTRTAGFKTCLVAITCYPIGKDRPAYPDTTIIRIKGG